jgi:hypothetical protein
MSPDIIGRRVELIARLVCLAPDIRMLSSVVSVAVTPFVIPQDKEVDLV